MIKSFLDRLIGAAPAAEETQAAARRSAAALLVEVARSDGDYADSERRMIDRILAEAYGLTPGQAAALRAEGETAQAAAAGSFRFTKTLKDTLDERERIAFLEQLWRVVLADAHRDSAEDAVMRRLAGLLYVSDQDSALARRRAVAAIGRG